MGSQARDAALFTLKSRKKSSKKGIKMETATGDSVYNLKTRSQKANIDPINEIQLLKKVSNESPEVQALIHDQIYHNFVEKVIDPDHGPLAEELANEDEFVPNDDSVIEVEDGGSSEEELDEEVEATVNKEIAASKTLDTVDEADIEEDDSESGDETDTNEPDYLDLIDDKKDMIYDDDVAYEPTEEGNKSDSEDSYASAEGEDSDDEADDDESEQENMDE